MVTQSFDFPFSIAAAYIGAWLGARSTPSTVVERAGWGYEAEAADCICTCLVPWGTLAASYFLGVLSLGLVLLGRRCGWCRGEWSLGAATQGGVAVGAPIASRSPLPASSGASWASSSASPAPSTRALEDSLAVWAPRRPRSQP